MENYYVRIWNLTGNRVYGWLGNEDGWAACVPAGLYSNPVSTPGAVVARWVTDGHDETVGKLAIAGEDGDLGLGGTGSGGVGAYWHDVADAYTLKLKSKSRRKLDSPVDGTMSGALAHVRDDKPIQLHAWYTINNDVFGFEYLDDAVDRGQLFSGGSLKLEFKASSLVFEFVPVSSFASDGADYVPPLTAKLGDGKALTMANWMGDLKDVIGNRPLADLVIPGSHDATSVKFDSANQNRRSRTQSRSIHDQLLAGVRYLDLRFSLNGGVYHGVHGSDMNMLTLDDVLADITSFLTEHPSEVLILSMLTDTDGDDLNNFWDIVLKALGDRVWPSGFTQIANGVSRDYFYYLKNASTVALTGQNKNIILFSWGRAPGGKVELNGAMKGKRRDQHVYAATPTDPELSAGSKPWRAAFEAAEKAGYELQFDLCGVWNNDYSTTAHDLRLLISAVEPPGEGRLWAMHTNAPAHWGPGHESIEDKAKRIQAPLMKLVREDPSMTAKLNVVNIDFVGDNNLAQYLVEANLRR